MSLRDEIVEAGFERVRLFLARGGFAFVPDERGAGYWGTQFACFQAGTADGHYLRLIAGRDSAPVRTSLLIFDFSEAGDDPRGRRLLAELGLDAGRLSGALGGDTLKALSPESRNAGLLGLVDDLRRRAVDAPPEGFVVHPPACPPTSCPSVPLPLPAAEGNPRT